MKRKTLIKILIFLVIATLIIITLNLYFNNINNNDFTSEDTSSKNQYSTKAIEIIDTNKLDKIYENSYSKTLDYVLQSDKYRIEYIDEYANIDYMEIDDFVSKINKYLDIGYNSKEINTIWKLSNKNQEKLFLLQKQNNFEKYLDIKNFNINNLERYEKYLKENNYDIQKTVTYVNINMDKDYYADIENINEITLTTLVNKYYQLPSDYKPEDLVPLFNNSNVSLKKEAANAYQKFVEGAKKDGITLIATSAYRSYSYQTTLYDNYVIKDGIDNADTYSARPGHSEHQLGVAVDLNDPNVEGKRLNGTDYEWIKNNAYKYGFIVRYTKEGEPITGYIEENWHIRYLGVELAKKVYESNLTYDEYYDLYLTEY